MKKLLVINFMIKLIALKDIFNQIWEKYPIHCVAELFSFLEWAHLYFDHV